MAANGEHPNTPVWWRLSIWWHPVLPGIDGLNEVMVPVVDVLARFDDQDARTFVISPQASDRLRFPPFRNPP